ncbi:MAG: trypsin-like peptidase domain-containing protein [Lachnospiraceae bacterium]|nr:trypsin-like peptidase domain-containing protein [Lachnospiraceae bacterium]
MEEYGNNEFENENSRNSGQYDSQNQGTENTGTYGSAQSGASGNTGSSTPDSDGWHNESRENGTWQNNNGSGYYQNGSGSGYYQNGFYQNTEGQHPKKRPHKSHPTAKKIGAVVLSAILFGGVAGGVMVGIQKAAGTSSSSSVTIPTTTSVASSSGSSTATTVSELDVESIAASVLPAMVELSGTYTETSSNMYWFGGNNTQTYTTAGTGIIIGQSDDSVVIMTNAHVVTDVSDLTATFNDGSNASASVVGSRSDKDVAVVKVKISDLSDSTLSQIAVATLNTDTSSLKVGEPVVAIGNALGEGQSVTSGIISATGRSITVNNYTYDDLIMTDAAINSGNSGGALLNANGEVIGINFAKSSDDGVQNMAYSIPVGDVIDLVESMSTNSSREAVPEGEEGFLGVSGVDITSDISSTYGYPQGLMIRYVQEGSAAANAGLAEYDVITAVDNQTVTSQSSLSSLLKYYKAGETVTITYYHLDNNQYVEKSVEVTLGSRPTTSQ